MPITVEDLCALLPRNTIAKVMVLQGPIFRKVADHRPGRYLIRHVTHGGLGRVGVMLARRARLLKRRNPIELAMNVLHYYFEPYMDDVEVNENKAVFHLKSCPYGWQSPEDGPLCDAVMEFERQLAAGLGIEFHIQETIPQGASKCRFLLSRSAGASPQ